jgi:hypothetical protein
MAKNPMLCVPESPKRYEFCMHSTYIYMIMTSYEPSTSHNIIANLSTQYAWFNGIDPNMMIKTDGAIEGSMECKEGESYKGKPEWECE